MRRRTNSHASDPSSSFSLIAPRFIVSHTSISFDSGSKTKFRSQSELRVQLLEF